MYTFIEWLRVRAMVSFTSVRMMFGQEMFREKPEVVLGLSPSILVGW